MRLLPGQFWWVIWNSNILEMNIYSFIAVILEELNMLNIYDNIYTWKIYTQKIME